MSFLNILISQIKIYFKNKQNKKNLSLHYLCKTKLVLELKRNLEVFFEIINKTYKSYNFIVKSGFKPDSGIVSAITSMKQNPKFSRLLGFSMNCLMPHLTPPNPKHRDNVNYLISGK